jgi:serine phosphatase RsbU (regulator of sigma subunit)
VRFRFRLALVFLLLSAFPLTLLALYSFTTSSGALRRAAEAEARLMARDLEQRVGNVSAEIDRSVRALARLPASYWLRAEPAGAGGQGGSAGAAAERGDDAAGKLDSQVFVRLAQALPFIEDFQFVPRPSGEPSPDPDPEPESDAESHAESQAESDLEPDSPETRAEAHRMSQEEAEKVEKSLRLAEQSVVATLAHLPTGMSEADRRHVQEELARVRAQIGKQFAERRGLQEEAAAQRALRASRLARLPAAVAPAAPPAPAAPAAGVPPAPPAARRPALAALAPTADGVSCPVRDGSEVVGEIRGKLKANEILRSVLAQTDREQGEIPFAIDEENRLYVAAGTDGAKLQNLPAVAALRGEKAAGAKDAAKDDWVVVARKEPNSGLRFGIARPISQAMKELRRATAFNFLAGFLLVGVATIGMIPLTGGMVKSVHQLEAGAAAIADGDLSTRVPVRSRDEFGRLAASFNHMAEQLAEHQARLIEQERLQKEREIERRLLEAENGRKSQELEEARLFQLSLLPRQLPEYAGLELAVAMSTATEVGGDYYDFRTAENGDLLIAIGDATGHGAAAGTMVTVAKSLFMSAGDGFSPAGFLRRSTALVHGMGLSRMAMALAVARITRRTFTLSSAGMPPALHFRAGSGTVEEISLPGMPLGARADFAYAERRLELAAGDVLLLMSDGFPELPNSAGEPLGYERARALFANAVAVSPGRAGEIVAQLERAAADWSGAAAAATGAPPPAPTDDVTFLVLRAT